MTKPDRQPDPPDGLTIDGLVRRYDGRAVVDGVSLDVAPGEVVVLVGPNGCGKTTMVEVALGLRRAHGGTVRIAGLDPWTAPQRDLALAVGVQLQRGSLHARVRLREHGAQLDAAYGRRGQFADLAQRLGLGDSLSRTYGALSGGQQRRALVASALVGSPRICLLDEPTSGVDVESRNEIWSVVRERASDDEMGVLITTHDLVEAERHADRVVIMRHGRFISTGAVDQVIGSASVKVIVDVRAAPDVLAAVKSASSAVEISRAAADVVYAFRDAPSADAWVDLLRSRGDLRVTRRAPTLEDAYLVLAAQEATG